MLSARNPYVLPSVLVGGAVYLGLSGMTDRSVIVRVGVLIAIAIVFPVVANAVRKVVRGSDPDGDEGDTDHGGGAPADGDYRLDERPNCGTREFERVSVRGADDERALRAAATGDQKAHRGAGNQVQHDRRKYRHPKYRTEPPEYVAVHTRSTDPCYIGVGESRRRTEPHPFYFRSP